MTTKKKPTTHATKLYRQGDVLIISVASIPANTQPIPRTKRGVILAEGEVTGHAHRIPSRYASLSRTETDLRYMRATAPVPLSHEEHKTACADPACASKATIATHRIDDLYNETAYRCDKHATPTAKKLDDPGATVLPPGDALVVIHHEYAPAAIQRVED